MDFLFLWDNSGSSTFINEDTKKALNKTINTISGRFDYHIMLAPLVGDRNNNAVFMSMTEEGLSDDALSIKIDRSRASQGLTAVGNAPGAGSYEEGIQRTIDLLARNQSNGIFRENGYTIVVIMSNGDDRQCGGGGQHSCVGAGKRGFYDGKYNDLMGVKEGLSSQQFRFISITPHRPCRPMGIRPNVHYRNMSNRIHPGDAYDLCNVNDFKKLFDGINKSIRDEIQKHKYDTGPWPAQNLALLTRVRLVSRNLVAPSARTGNASLREGQMDLLT